MVTEWGLSVCSGLSWLRAQISARHSRTWQRIFVLRELYNIPWQEEGPSSFREGKCSTEQSYRGWSIGTQISGGGARFGYPLRHVTRRFLVCLRSLHVNTTCQSIIQHFIVYTIKIVYCQGDTFRPLLGHFKALWENRSKSYLYFNALWDPKCFLCEALLIEIHACTTF